MNINYQPKIFSILDNLCQISFVNGWGFIFPYLIFYLCFWYLNLPINQLFNIFIILHIFNSLLLVYFIYQNKHNFKIKKIIFWLIIALILIIPGAYLEYPSDPWAHFQRIFSFQNVEFIKDSFIKNKFSYFWGWTLMSNIEPIYRRFALDIYSTFWQLLFYYQFYLLALKLGIDKYWSKINILGILFLFGTYIFSFRYYAISSTIVAYIAYIRAIIILINIQKGESKKQLFLLIPLLLIMYFNHIQEVILFFISALALFIDYLMNKNKKYTMICLLLIFTIFCLLGGYLINDPNFNKPTLWNINDPFISSVGNFKIWDLKLSYFETVGIHGVFALIFALILFKKYQTISLLTLTPYFLLLFPPFTFLFSSTYKIGAIESNWVTYRALYAFPTSFMFVLGLKEILPFVTQKIKQINLAKNNHLLSIIIVLIIILIPPNYPFRGRFWFQMYKAPQTLSLENIDITAQWFYDNRKLDKSCLLAGDRVTQFAIITHFALRDQPPHRTVPYNITNKIKNKRHLDKYIKNKNVCKFLIAQVDKLPNIPSSKVAQISGHWDANLVKYNMTLTPEFTRLVDTLTETGWQKTFVPPFYYLYEKPQ